ncbi:MAG: hypothetical protein AAF657_40320 [Acidobacteriota bacterium]
MQRQSQLILARLRSAEDVEASVTLNGSDIGQRLDDRFAPNVAVTEVEASRPAFRDILFTLRDELVASRQRLSSIDNDHVENLRHFLEKRARRDEVLNQVYGQLSVSRRTIEDLFETENAFILAGIEGPTARETEKLLKQVDLAIDRLKSPDLVLPEPKVKGIQVDPASLVEDLESEAARLRAVNRELRKARRAVQRSRKIKNAAIEEHDRTFLWLARTLEGYYQLADEAELAKQIRPSTRRPGRRAAEVRGEATSDEPSSLDSSSEEQTADGQTVPQSADEQTSDEATVSDTPEVDDDPASQTSEP